MSREEGLWGDRSDGLKLSELCRICDGLGEGFDWDNDDIVMSGRSSDHERFCGYDSGRDRERGITGDRGGLEGEEARGETEGKADESWCGARLSGSRSRGKSDGNHSNEHRECSVGDVHYKSLTLDFYVAPLSDKRDDTI